MWKKRTYSCSNFLAISSLVLELLKKCRVRYRVGHPVLKLCHWIEILVTHSFVYTGFNGVQQYKLCKQLKSVQWAFYLGEFIVFQDYYKFRETDSVSIFFRYCGITIISCLELPITYSILHYTRQTGCPFSPHAVVVGKIGSNCIHGLLESNISS